MTHTPHHHHLHHHIYLLLYQALHGLVCVAEWVEHPPPILGDCGNLKVADWNPYLIVFLNPGQVKPMTLKLMLIAS